MKSIILGALFIIPLNFIAAQYTDSISIALEMIGLSFDQGELDSMKQNLHGHQSSLEAIRAEKISNDLPYSMVFTPPLNHDRYHLNNQTLFGIYLKMKIFLQT